MIVSIALLGFGASGTALTIVPALQKAMPPLRLSQLALATGLSMFTAYLLTNWLPFDSFSIAWDHRQVWILILHYIALATPFFFSGMALGFLFSAAPQAVGTTYAVSLLGSAAGCVIALIAPARVGGEGMVTLSIALASLAGLVSSLRTWRFPNPRLLLTLGMFLFALLDLGLHFMGPSGFSFMELRLSPYKSLSYALQYPGSSVISRQWNAFSRVDVVRSGGIHSLPGLSYRYLEPLPSLDGLLVDGEDLNPVLDTSTSPGFVEYLPNAVAFKLRPRASTLILEPRGGLDVVTALDMSSGPVTAVEINPLIADVVPAYEKPRVVVHVESDRSYLSRTPIQFDVIVFSLTSSFHPVRSGAYALGEEYRYTVESFREALAHMGADGLLVATRWLQNPPSEDLRLFALAVTALEENGADPRWQIVAFRGYNTATLLIKNSAFTARELSSIREFAGERAFDLTYLPRIRPDQTNKYNILPESIYYQTYISLLETNPRARFYAAYDYDVRPPTDDHPFFGHYFKWSQAPQVVAEFGRAWQPFGGAGYFVVLALLLLAVVLASFFILLPVAAWKRASRRVISTSPFSLRHLVYFGLLGLAFLFVEIPLLQRFILYLGHPAYAISMVLFSLLLFSGVGSRWSDRIAPRVALPALVILILLTPILLPRLFAWTLGLPLVIRLGLTSLLLAPVGFLMGIPFPAGIRLMERQPARGVGNEPSTPARGAHLPYGVWRTPARFARQIGSAGEDRGTESQVQGIPWVWAVNGAASVVASILSALLALTFGFNWVLRLGALCYAIAWFTVWTWPQTAQYRSR
jgi:hypothetical protein